MCVFLALASESNSPKISPAFISGIRKNESLTISLLRALVFLWNIMIL